MRNLIKTLDCNFLGDTPPLHSSTRLRRHMCLGSGLISSNAIVTCVVWVGLRLKNAEIASGNAIDSGVSVRPLHRQSFGHAPDRRHPPRIRTLLTVRVQLFCHLAHRCHQTFFLSSAAPPSGWSDRCGNFNYKDFYKFINYFEADGSPSARKETQVLLGWWNK